MPESDPGDGEIGDAEEFLRELDRVEYDDTLLGLVGEGYDVNAPGDQAVADFLGTWRDDVRRVPLDRSQMPSAHTARGELPPGPTTGGTVSATEDAAAQIRALANSSNVPTQVLDEAYQRLNTFMGEIQAATGENSQHRADLLGSTQQAQGAIQTAISACTQLLDDIQRAADGHARG